MSGAHGQSLLVLSRQEKGRVALLLSDHAWLWARGYQGGGPHVDLLRRLSHWLMQEPDLEEEALRALVRGRELVVERQTMARHGAADHGDGPDGQGQPNPDACRRPSPGSGAASLTTDAMGLWRVTDGTLDGARQCRAGQSPRIPGSGLDDRSAQGPDATDARLLAPRRRRRGCAQRAARRCPSRRRSVCRRRLDRRQGGERQRRARRFGAAAVRRLLGLALLLGALAATWAREGR